MCRKPGSSCPSCRELADQRPWWSTSSAARASNSTCQKKPASSRSCSPVGDPLVCEVVPLQRSELAQPPPSLSLQRLLSPRPANPVSQWRDWFGTCSAFALNPNWLPVSRAHHLCVKPAAASNSSGRVWTLWKRCLTSHPGTGSFPSLRVSLSLTSAGLARFQTF